MQTLKIGGETYTVQIGFAAANLLQEITQKPLGVIMQHMAAAGTLYLSTTFYAATRIHHSGLTMDQVEQIMEQACAEGKLAQVIKATAEELGKMLNLSGVKSEEPQKKASGSTRKG